MNKNKVEIVAYNDRFRNEILDIWEKSVQSTHTFLAKNDFLEIKEMVKSIDFKVFKVFCLTKCEHVNGFVGVAGTKIEMLFLDPFYFGNGYGKKLLQYATKELNADHLDVNEQNTNALYFYKKAGFEIFERTKTDDQGRNYPLLRMKLNPKEEHQIHAGKL